MTERLRVGVLASGAGSNLQAILDHVSHQLADEFEIVSVKDTNAMPSAPWRIAPKAAPRIANRIRAAAEVRDS